MSVLDNIQDGGSSVKESEFTLESDPFGDDYPGIFEVLCRQKYAGEARQTGRLIIYSEPGKGCCCLCDKQQRIVAFHIADGLTAALEGLEKRLQEGSLDWRRDKRARYG
jgi:hypothetical protein